MQHWVLCELLNTACNSSTTHLTFVDAHAMAPVACQRKGRSPIFDAVSNRLPEQGSRYEQAWLAISPEKGTYPNSANFVARIWRQPSNCSMVLCEKDYDTVESLRYWASKRRGLGLEISVADGDWRKRFECELPKPKELMLISFDPYKFDINPCTHYKSGNMYLDDLDLLLKATRPYQSNVLIQLSTYSVKGGNDQEQVAKEIRTRLEPKGIEQVTKISPNGKKMMSLIYQRGVAFSEELTSLSDRFNEWFDSIR